MIMSLVVNENPALKPIMKGHHLTTPIRQESYEI